MLDKLDKRTLKAAASIIRDELSQGREVAIPGFGKLYLSRVPWTDNDTGEFGKTNTVRFRPFGALKDAVGNREVLGTLGDDGTKPLDNPPDSTVETYTPSKPAPVLTLHPLGS